MHRLTVDEASLLEFISEVNTRSRNVKTSFCSGMACCFAAVDFWWRFLILDASGSLRFFFSASTVSRDFPIKVKASDQCWDIQWLTYLWETHELRQDSLNPGFADRDPDRVCSPFWRVV